VLLPLMALSACVAALPGCTGGDGGDTTPPGGVLGKVVVDGSSTVAPITTAAAEAFRQQDRSIEVVVGISGTGGGFKRFTQDETDISDASRPIKPAEFASCKQHGVSFLELPVAYDGLTVVVHPQNDWCNELTVAELQKIYLADGAARTWRDVRAEWPDVPIQVYSPGTDSGTYDYFKEVVAPAGESLRADMSTSEDDNVLVTGVSGQRGAVGYFGIAYYEANREKLRAVKIVNPRTGAAVAPNLDTVRGGDYAPLSRPLFIYVNLKSLDRPEVQKFVNFYLDNVATLVASAEYIPLPDELYQTVRDVYSRRLPGTAFVQRDGTVRTGTLAEVYKPENLVAP
jgi:phosphate transport system substrate-binding protein